MSLGLNSHFETEAHNFSYSAYTDKQLAGNKVLIPDQSYTPANLS